MNLPDKKQFKKIVKTGGLFSLALVIAFLIGYSAVPPTSTAQSTMIYATNTPEIAAITTQDNEVLSDTDVLSAQPENPLPTGAVRTGSNVIKIVLGLLLTAGIVGVWLGYKKR